MLVFDCFLSCLFTINITAARAVDLEFCGIWEHTNNPQALEIKTTEIGHSVALYLKTTHGMCRYTYLMISIAQHILTCHGICVVLEDVCSCIF